MVKKGSAVIVTDKWSYWYNNLGIVVSVEKSELIRYPVVVRFNSVNYGGSNTSNFAFSDLREIPDPLKKEEKE